MAVFTGCSAAAAESGKVPTTYEDLDPFVRQFNTYVGCLQQGVLDLKQWARVKRAWERMTRWQL